MGTSCLHETKGRSCWGFVDRVTFRRYLLRRREGCSGDGSEEEEEEEEGEGMRCTVFYLHATPAPSFPLSKNSPSSWRRATTGQKQESESKHGASVWVALSEQKEVGGRKERGARKFSA